MADIGESEPSGIWMDGGVGAAVGVAVGVAVSANSGATG